MYLKYIFSQLDAGQAAIDAIMSTGGQSWVHGTVCETICKISFVNL